MTTTVARVLKAQDAQTQFTGSIGARFLVDSEDSERRVSVVEQPMSPRALAAPLHRHHREDEYTYVLEGRVGALLGDEVVEAGPGEMIFKPRNQWHTFWNAGDEPARILEIISPAGFERFLQELVDLGGLGDADPSTLLNLCARYEMDMDADSIPRLVERFGLTFPGEAV